MRFWNLSELSEIEDQVAFSYSPWQMLGRRRRPAGGLRQRPTRLTVALGVAVLTTSFTISPMWANSNKLSVPLAAMTVAQSVAEEKPPLEDLFVGRFNSQRTEALENEFLKNAERKRSDLTKEAITEQVIDSIFSNQQEELSGKVDRLDRDAIGKIVRSRKLI